MRKFDQFLRGTKFTLVTDHKPLIHLLGPQRNLPKIVNNRLVRWALLIGSYDYDIIFKKGEHNLLADYCSRMPNPEEQPSDVEIGIHKIGITFQCNKIHDLLFTEENLRKATKQDPVLKQIRQLITLDWNGYQQSQNDLKPYHRKRHELSVENKIVMWQGRIVVPESLRKATLRHLHLGHPGISAMRALARFYVWWPSIDEDIDNEVKLCRTCQENSPNQSELPIFAWSIPDKVWERIHIDFAGPFQGKFWLVLCDALSKWIEIKPMEKITSAKLIEELETIFTTFGLPEIIVSDNGPQLTSHEFQEFCKEKCILHIRSSPYHPRTNGLAERLVRTFKSRMASDGRNEASSKRRLNEFLFSYRSTPHSTTKKSPAEMMFGRQLSCILSNARPNTKRSMRHRQIQANITNESRVPNYNEGDNVYVKTRIDTKWKPAVVSHRTNRYSYVVNTPDGVQLRRHADHLRPRASSSEITKDTV